MSPDQIGALIMMAVLLTMVIGGVHLAFALMFLSMVFGLIYQGSVIFPMGEQQVAPGLPPGPAGSGDRPGPMVRFGKGGMHWRKSAIHVSPWRAPDGWPEQTDRN